MQKKSNLMESVKKYLGQNHIMQIATASNNKPWICSVYYVADNKLNLYWASTPDRRHSREIAKNDNASIAVAVQGAKDKQVIGLQAEGTAAMLEKHSDIKPIAEQYAEEFDMSTKWVEDFAGLKTKHRLYKFTPISYVLFDEANFPRSPRREIKLS